LRHKLFLDHKGCFRCIVTEDAKQTIAHLAALVSSGKVHRDGPGDLTQAPGYNDTLKTIDKMNYRVLFVCTGNYYRSRFAEMLFNALASRAGLDCKAISRGIAAEGSNNIGPISPLVLKKLKNLGIPVEAEIRMPIQLEETDFEDADLIIALDAAEHGPWMTRRFAGCTDQIVYWNVSDLHLMKAEEALTQIENNVTTLIKQLQSRAELL
jgi:low molecular weight protein-tyrosine phosphatase